MKNLINLMDQVRLKPKLGYVPIMRSFALEWFEELNYAVCLYTQMSAP